MALVNVSLNNIINFIGLLWCIENEEKILTAEQENIKTPESMKRTLTSEEILNTLPSSRSVEFVFIANNKTCTYFLAQLS